MDEELTPAALEIRDGETLYLRPRDSQLPPAHFDDLIDGLATGVRGRPDRWRGSMTRALFLIACVVCLVVCFALLWDRGFPGRVGAAAAVAGLLVFGAFMCSRALGDSWAAFTLGGASVPFAAFAGFWVPSGAAALTSIAPNVLCAAMGAGLAAMLAMFVGQRRAVFLSLWLTCVAGALGGLLGTVGLSPVQAAAAVVVLVLMLSLFSSTFAFRLAKLRLPQLPTGAADLAEDIEPFPGPALMEGAARADSYLTWLTVMVGAVCTVGAVILVRQGGPTAAWLVAAISVSLMLRSRGLTGGWQRAALLTPALAGPALLIWGVCGWAAPPLRPVALMGLLAVAGSMVAYSRSLPGRRLMPYWGRIADVVEYLVAVAVALLLLGIFDAYHWARALGG
jgi:type VII secretion integral membrane protein EccD